MRMKKEILYTVEGLCLAGSHLVRRRISIQGGRIGGARSSGPPWQLKANQILMPAFHDHHAHMVGTCRPPQGPCLDGALSEQDCLERTVAWLRTHPGSSPVVGEGWDDSIWGDARPLTRVDLDRIAPDRPVALRRVCGHMAIVNSAAWEALSPGGAEADRETGIITESLALGLAARWPPSPEDLLEGVRRAQAEAARHGVAAIDEIGRLDGLRAMRRLGEQGELWLRVRYFLPLPAIDELRETGVAAGPAVGSGSLTVCGLKGFLDGSIGARTAAVSVPYADGKEPGLLLWEADRLMEAVRRGSGEGFTIILHAIGGRAVEQAVAALEQAAPARAGTPHRIEHAEEIDARLLVRAAAAGIALSMQPNFTARWQGPGGMYERALGAERVARLNPYRSAAAAAPVLFGSDMMPFGPLEGLAGAVGHPEASESLPPALALAAYTREGIVPLAERDLLAIGEPADMTVLDLPEGDLGAALRSRGGRVIWTAAAGRTVWSDTEAGVPDFLVEAAA